MSYCLFLDDLRLCPDGFIVARTYNDAVNLIKEKGLPSMISFDHDLGEEKTGYDFAKFIVNYCLDFKLPPPLYYVHSANPVGAENIECLLSNFEKYTI